MSNTAENLQPIVDVLELFKPFDHFSKAMLDAFVVIDGQGRVLKSNQLFSILVGKKTKQILKSNSLDEILKFVVNDKKITVEELCQNFSPTRLDEVRGVTDEKDDLNLILGLYPFVVDGVVEGLFLLIRDVTAETNLQDKYKVKATQSITDNLTGLYNRAFFDNYLPQQIERLSSFPQMSSQRDLTIMMLDIDHFKKCNDTYGHQAGDYVIASVSEIFREILRKTDIACRYGGEEFLAILHATDLEGASVAAEKIRQKVASTEFIHEGVKIPITISIGVAQVSVGRETVANVISRADAALYFSKEHGRNKVSLHQGGNKII